MRTVRSLLLAAPALLAALLVAGAPLIQGIHIAKYECGRGSHCCHQAPARVAVGAPVCSLDESRCTALGKSKGNDRASPKGSRSGRHHHDSTTCPICQMYLTLVKGVSLPAGVVTVGVAEITQSESLPQQIAPTFGHILTASPRAPPCC